MESLKYSFGSDFTIEKWNTATSNLPETDKAALYNELSRENQNIVDQAIRDSQIQEFMRMATKPSSVASAFQKELFTRIPEINLFSSISELKEYESVNSIGEKMEVDNMDKQPLSELVSRLGSGKLDPKDASIFLPQLKRFKNYVLTNLKKARTSQARISNLDSHSLHYYHTLSFHNIPPLSEAATNEINLLIFNKMRRHVYEHHAAQVKTSQTAINEAVGKMRDELQKQLEEIRELFNNDYAAITTAQNIIDRNLAELVTFINELTTRTALAVETSKVTNQLFNQGFSVIFKIFTQNINQIFTSIGARKASSRPTTKGKEKATEEASQERSSTKEGFKQKSSRPKVIIGVNNISTIKLPDYVTEVLNLGANFQIPSIPTKKEQEESWKQTWGQLQTSAQQKGKKHFEKSLEIILDSYKTCLLPRANKKYLKHNKCSHILIAKINKCSKFLIDNNLIVVVADKGFGLTVVTKEWFTEQLRKHINSNNYVLYTSPLNQEQIRRELYTIIAKFGNKQLSRNLTNLVSDIDAVLPEMYVIPKLHKKPVSSRPITPSHKWLTCKAAKWLAKRWQKYADRIFSILPNSLTLINKFSVKFFPETYELVALDIDNFYPSINAKHAGKTISEYLLDCGFINYDKIDEFRLEYQVYEWICNNTYVSVLDKIYKQVSGLPMGSPISPVVANLYLAALESKVAKSFRGMTIYRYLDDVLLLVDTSILKTYEINYLPKALFNEINQHAKPSKFEITITQIGWPIDFLDLVIDKKFEEVRSDGLKYYQVTFNSFDKPGNLHLYTNPSTFYPRNYVWNWIQGENIRLIRNNSEFSSYDRALNDFIHFLTRRQYPSSIIQRQIAKTKFEERERLLEPVQKKSRSGHLIKVANTASRPIVTRLVRRAIRLYNTLYPERRQEVSLLVTRGQSLQTTTTRSRRKVLTQ